MQDVSSEIIQLLGRGACKARFVTELMHQLERSEVSLDAVERDLALLEATGQVLIREQHCGDPHMVGTDLRIVGLIQPPGAAAPGADQDPLSRAIFAIDATWQRWLTEYLASHRCG